MLCFCYFKPACIFHLISEELKNAQSYTKDFKQQILDLRGTLSPRSHYYVVARVLLPVITFFLLILFNAAFSFFYASFLCHLLYSTYVSRLWAVFFVIQSIHLCFAVITDKLLEEQETTRKKEEFVAHLKSKSSKANTNVQD